MPVTNVDRGLDVLEALARRPAGASLGGLAEAVGLPKSALHRVLHRLAERGYVLQDATTQDYALSLKLPLLGFRYLDAERLADVAQVALDGLAADTGEYCRIALVEAGALTWVACAQGATAGLRYHPPMGREVVLHATATGKAYLSTMRDADALAAVQRRGWAVPAGFGPRVLKSARALFEQLAEARRAGYALAIDEGEPGITALAAPFRALDAPDAPVAGTVSVAGPSARLGPARVKKLAPRLLHTARELTRIWPVRVRQRPEGAGRVPASEAAERAR